jgi:septal ring factor EnvC (AmiA/AmiB activator)
MFLPWLIDEPDQTGRRDRAGPAACRVAALALLFLAAACSVPRPRPLSHADLDSATLPNLRRSQEALQDTLAREREHVGALNLQIRELRAEEGRLNERFIESEHDYLLLEDDLASVEEELAAVRADIQAARKKLKAAKDQVKALAAELGQVQAQRVEIRAAISALAALVERGRVALASLPPAMRALIQEEVARAAEERVRPANTPVSVTDAPEPDNAAEDAEDGSSGGD